MIFKVTPCRSKFLHKFISWIITFEVKAHQVVVISFDRVSSKKKTDYPSLRLDMSSEEVVLSDPVEQVFVHLNDLTHWVDDLDQASCLLLFS